jgi:uncharacterized protein YdaU (DUF1376 family)
MKPLFVQWCAKDYLDGVQTLDMYEELAYHRILNLIYATDDQLPDNDSVMRGLSKIGGRWKKVRASLLEKGKIQIVDGRITNKKCTEKLGQTHDFLRKQSEKGKASAERRKSMKENETASTVVGTVVITPEATGGSTNREPLTDIEELEVSVTNVTSSSDDDPPVLDLTPDEQPKPDPEDEAMTEWNRLAEEHQLPAVQVFSKERRSRLKARLKECDGIVGWRDAMDKVRASPFLLGETSDFRADFDMVTRKGNFIKLMEDGYAGSDKNSNGKYSGETGNHLVDGALRAMARWESEDETTEPVR